MENPDSTEKNEKINNNNIDSQHLEPLNNNNNENNKEDENETPNRIVLKKNVRKILLGDSNNKIEKENEENENENEFLPNIEIDNINEKNSEQILNNNNYNEMKDEPEEEKKIESKENENEEDKNNELKDDFKKEEGYLDSDLEDDDNKKLYLRVIKRMEKTYSVPIDHAKIPGEPIDDIELETDIRPILINNENKIMNNKKNNEMPKYPNSYNNNKYLNNNNIQNNYKYQ